VPTEQDRHKAGGRNSVGYVTVNKFVELTGYSDDAVRAKIQKGQWLDGREYHRAPDGKILISMEAFDKWVEGQAFAPLATKPSRSRLRIAADTSASA
jgi:hypothetical protein